MIIEQIYEHRRGLGGGFVMGILLFGILVAVTGWVGAITLLIVYLLFAGVVGAALGVAIEAGIYSVCNRVKDWQISTVLLEEPLIEPTQANRNDFRGMEDIGDFESWGETVRISLYNKTVAEKMEEVKKDLESGTELLVKRYKKLALKYHPDRESKESEKDTKTVAFQRLREVCETIEKHWELALKGIDVSIYSEPEPDMDTRTGLDLLREYHDLLKAYMERREKAHKEMEDFFNNKEERAKFVREIVDELMAEYPNTDFSNFWSEEKEETPQVVLLEEEEPLNEEPLNDPTLNPEQ